MENRQIDTVCKKFYSTCEKFPSCVAQRFNPELYGGDNNGMFTYDEMKKRVESISCGLMSLGFEKQEKIAIMSESGPYWTHADMAISNCAGVSVTIYPTLSFNEVSYIINDSGSRYAFVDSEDNVNTIISGIDKLPSLQKIIVMDLKYKGDNKHTIGLGELIEAGSKWKEDNYSTYEQRWKGVVPDDGFTVLYTSGTTGQGKGVLITHWTGMSRLEGCIEFLSHGMEITEEDVTLCFLPLSHIFERGSCQLLAIARGSCIAYADKPGTLLEDMQKYNPTWINCVPRLYEKIYITFTEKMSESPMKKKLFDMALAVGKKALEYRKNSDGSYNMSPDFDLESKLPLALRIQYKLADKLFAKVRALFGNRFRIAFSASAGIAPDLLKFYYAIGLVVSEGYGSTESCNACILSPIDACKPGYMGKATPGTLSRIAEDGELEISGVGIFKEYLNKPEDTKESFTDDGWFKTGDVVEMDSNGYFRIVDRKKAIICTAVGKNIAPAKLENLFALSSVVDQMFPIGDERNYISALIVPNYTYFINLFDKENIPYNKEKLVYSDIGGVRMCVGAGEDFIKHPKLKELIEKDVEVANEQLEGFERIRKYTILANRFTEDNDQLTPTQKTKKRVILKDYAETIDQMY